MSTLFSDTFNRADGALGADWTALGTTGTIAGNQYAGPATEALDYYDNGTPPANCYVQAVAVNIPTAPNFAYIALRLDTATANFYQVGWDATAASIKRVDAGVPTTLGATLTSPSAGQTVRLEASGSTLSVYYDGILQATRTDSTYSAAGRSGIGSLGTGTRVDDFQTGTIAPGASTGPGLVIGDPAGFVGEGAIGAPNVDSDRNGTLASTLDNATLAAGGTITLQGTAAPTLADLTLSATAEIDIVGTSGGTLEPATLASTAALALQGATAVTLDDATLASAGELEIAAALAATLDAATLSATATVAVQGAADATLADLTLSAAGEIDLAASSNVTLEALTLSATGLGAGIAGSLEVTLGDATLASTAELDIAGASGGQLEPVTLSGTGALAITGALSATLEDLTVSTGASEPAELPASTSPGGGGRRLRAPRGSTRGFSDAPLSPRNGQLTARLGDVTTDAQARIKICGTAACRLDDARLVSEATIDWSGAIADDDEVLLFARA